MKHIISAYKYDNECDKTLPYCEDIIAPDKNTAAKKVSDLLNDAEVVLVVVDGNTFFNPNPQWNVDTVARRID